jgi:hypothetical protein
MSFTKPGFYRVIRGYDSLRRDNIIFVLSTELFTEKGSRYSKYFEMKYLINCKLEKTYFWADLDFESLNILEPIKLQSLPQKGMIKL